MNMASGYEWATHQPLIKAVMELYKPAFVLELGSGIYSTPLFLSYGVEFVTIENDKGWCQKIKDEYSIQPILHEIRGVHAGTGYNELTVEQRRDIFKYYRNLEVPEVKPRLLFVDNYCACRLLSIDALSDRFDLIIYHDSESLVVNNFCEVDSRGFKTYTLETSGPHTTLMVREDKGFDELQGVIEHLIQEFFVEYPCCKLMKLIQKKSMREVKEIRDYWDIVHTIKHQGALSGTQYDDAVSSLFLTDKLIEGSTVLEVGSGLGYVTKGLREHGLRVSVLDIAPVALETAREFCESVYLVDEIESLPDDYFDVIICQNVIQHIPTYILENELPHIIRSLKPTGTFAVQFVSAKQFADTGIGTPVILALNWDENIGHYARTPSVLEKMINECGGKCKMVSEMREDINELVNGMFVFHVTKYITNET
jgi:ubiquinone/menaquinone biosynthesis C-methylase UbiE